MNFELSDWLNLNCKFMTWPFRGGLGHRSRPAWDEWMPLGCLLQEVASPQKCSRRDLRRDVESHLHWFDSRDLHWFSVNPWFVLKMKTMLCHGVTPECGRGVQENAALFPARSTTQSTHSSSLSNHEPMLRCDLSFVFVPSTSRQSLRASHKPSLILHPLA